MIMQIHAVVGLVAVVAMIVCFAIMFRAMANNRPSLRRKALVAAVISLVIGTGSCLSAFALGLYMYVP